MNKIALSFDVEDWYHTPVITGYSFSKYKTVPDFFERWNERYDCLTEGFLPLMELLDKKEVTATFYLVADVIERYPEIVRYLKLSTHEIACHSLHHQIPLNPQTRQVLQSETEWENDLVIAKQAIENCFGKKIIGYRAPGAFFTNWMVDILLRNEFEYDSSVAYNNFYNKTNVLLENVPTHPYLLNKNSLNTESPSSGLVELPWSNYSLFNFKMPAGGAFFYRLLGNAYFIRTLNQCLKSGDTMFYMHPLDFSETKFPLHNHFRRPMYWVNKGKKSLNMFSQLLDKFEGKWDTCGNIYGNFKTTSNGIN